MQIGELAKQAGCPVETVRYYEREGLLHAAVRNESNNYRQYNLSHLDRLTFIRRCRSLEARMTELRALEGQLIDLRSQCHAARATRDCGILRELDHPGDTAWRSPALTHSHVSGSHSNSDVHNHGETQK